MNVSRGRCVTNSGVPLLAFTTKQGLVVDFDCFDIDTTKKWSKKITEKYGCGDVLVVYSNFHGQMTLEGKKACHFHSIFGAVLPHEKVQGILKQLVTWHIVEELFRFFNQVEWELTLRTVPKRICDPIPSPCCYIKVDGQDTVIKHYLEQAREDQAIFKEVCLNGGVV